MKQNILDISIITKEDENVPTIRDSTLFFSRFVKTKLKTLLLST